MAWHHWQALSFLTHGVSMGIVLCRKVFTTDATLTDWGGVYEGWTVRSSWSTNLQRSQINFLELSVVSLSLKHILPLPIRHHALVRTDTTKTVEYINHQGGLRSHRFHTLAHRVFLWSFVHCHVKFGGHTASQHLLIYSMKGEHRFFLVSLSLVCPWDLAVVLEGLKGPTFQPLQGVDMKLVSLKTVLFLALVSAGWISDIHVRYSVCCFTGETAVSHVLSGLCDTHLHGGFRRSKQLFVSFADPHKGKVVTKERLPHWVVKAFAFTSQDLRLLEAHSTQGLCASWVLFK